MTVAKNFRPNRRTVLTIAGSDSGGGAGIQADLRAISAGGLHGASAITALTAQNTRVVARVEVVSAAMIQAQIEAAFADFDIAAIKIGMLFDAGSVDAVADALARLNPAGNIPLVLDPVLIATVGAPLATAEALPALLARLVPRATIVTPNLPEAAALASAKEGASVQALGEALLERGCRAVLLKGGHGSGPQVIDRIFRPGSTVSFPVPRRKLEGHGAGCTLASALATRLAQGDELEDACATALAYLQRALDDGYQPGRGGLTVLPAAH